MQGRGKIQEIEEVEVSTEGFNKVSLANIGNGAAIELFDAELPAVYENLLDPETDPKKPRSIRLEVKFRKNPQNPTLIDYDISVSKKLAGHGHNSVFEIGMEDGEVTGYESEGIQNPLPGVSEGRKVLSLHNKG
jgi:hypothetical protein